MSRMSRAYRLGLVLGHVAIAAIAGAAVMYLSGGPAWAGMMTTLIVVLCSPPLDERAA